MAEVRFVIRLGYYYQAARCMAQGLDWQQLTRHVAELESEKMQFELSRAARSRCVLFSNSVTSVHTLDLCQLASCCQPLLHNMSCITRQPYMSHAAENTISPRLPCAAATSL